MKLSRHLIRHLPPLLLGTAVLSAANARAETSAVSPAGFLVKVQREVSATPHEVYRTIAYVGRWWSSAHTWSGNAANLSIDVRAGGCFCERWGGNSVMHAQVISVLQDEMLSLHGSLGPLQQRAVNGILTFTTKASGNKTALMLTYKVVGNADSGLDTMAPAVDRVLDEHLGRLASLIETGRPDSAAGSSK